MFFSSRTKSNPSARIEPLAAKVPEIVGLFWVLKILTTGMGEAMSDAMGQNSVPAAAVIGIGGFAYAMRLQFRATEYRAPVYWFAVMMVAVFGTMVADGVHVAAGLPYGITTPLAAIAVGAVFYLWHRNEGTLSIHSINTRRRERYYWTAVLATFALGTAAGDLTALSLNLGYLDSAVLFALIIAVPALAWRRSLINPTVAFWAAYVVTRPLGASIADWFAKEPDKGGLGIGDATVAALALIVFVALVAYTAITKNDIQEPGEARASAAPLPASA